MTDEEKRLNIAKEAEEKFAQARKFFAAGRHEEALEAYLFAFDNSRLVYGWGGVRLSYIPSEIAKLGEIYPQAKLELIIRRDRREALILEGETSYEVVSEWQSLNTYLGDSTREVDLVNSLLAEGKECQKLFEMVSKAHPQDFPDNSTVQEDRLNSLGSNLYHWLMNHEINLLFSRRFGVKEQAWLTSERETIIEDGSELYKLLLIQHRKEIADEVELDLLSVVGTKEMYRELLRVATQVQSAERVDRLRKHARDNLSRSDFQWLEAK